MNQTEQEKCIQAQNLFVNNRFDESAKLFTELTTSHPENALYWKGLGYCQEKLRLFQEGIYSFTKGIERNNKDADIYLGLGLCYLGLKQPKDALKPLEQTIKLNPDHKFVLDLLKDVYLTLAEQEKKKEKIEWARGYLEKANDLPGNDPDILLALIEHYSEFQEYEKAKIWVKKVIECFPHIPEVPELKERFGMTKQRERGFLY